MDPRKIKVIFLDIGGVLLSNGWGHESRQKAAEKFGMDYEEMEVLHNFIYNVFEIGSISLDDYLDTVVFHEKRKFGKEEFKEFMYDESVELPGTLPWLKKWKKDCGFRIFAINNESREINDYRIEKFGLHENFDGFFSSCYVGMRKPDPGLFRAAMDITQVLPNECVYLDDRPNLVQTAIKLGINSYRHENYERTRETLEELKREKEAP